MSALDHGGCVEFDEHARLGELTDDEEGVCREGMVAIRLRPAFAVFRQKACVGDIGDLLHDVLQRGAVPLENLHELRKGVAALGGEIAHGLDYADLFVLGADAGKDDHLAGACHRDRFGETTFGPGAIVEMLLVHGFRRSRFSPRRI
jgi:hypothetical protein